ncbi:hypothetical protein AAE250_07780 [Bacteroides sp. GD17]|jgi:hypothetical protein|uniref:hypothetical protein n=1 Tax=Bacteroides sp. GD17 TaxID=3139826 RepID=UPI00313E57E4
MKTNRIISSSSFGNSNSFGSSFVLLFAAALVQLLSLSACSKDKEEYFNPDGTLIKHPGQVTINLDGVPQDHTATIALASANGTPYTLQSATPTYVEAGSYTITIVSHPTTSTLPQQLEILHARPAEGGSNIASGTGLLRITPDDDGSLINLPPISGAIAPVSILHNDNTPISLSLRPLTREVTINGLLQGLDPTTVSTLHATLYGLSNERPIDQPFEGITKRAAAAVGNIGGAAAIENAGTTRSSSPDYSLSTPFTPAADGTFTLSLRLLGIDPSLPQRLRLTLTYRDPSAAPYTYEADITSLLTDFNTGPANQPAHLNATLSFGLGDITTTITNWTPGTDQDITGQ